VLHLPQRARNGCTRSWTTSRAARGRLEHLDLLEELALVVKDTTMCGLGQTASNPVLSTLRYFREEYVGVCPVGAVIGEKDEVHIIDRTKCINCGACRSFCKFGAVDVH
jgi:NADH-quinone oxidoreductase subunit F